MITNQAYFFRRASNPTSLSTLMSIPCLQCSLQLGASAIWLQMQGGGEEILRNAEPLPIVSQLAVNPDSDQLVMSTTVVRGLLLFFAF